jgi:hypothetical protein
MKKMYIIIAIITLLVLAGLYLAFDYWRVIKTQGPNTKVNTGTLTTGLKAYSLVYTTLNPDADQLEFKHIISISTGASWTTLIIPLPNNQFLITKFTWYSRQPVQPGEQDTKGTYIYSDNKLSPVSVKLTYSDDGNLDGRIMGWGSSREGATIVERALLIHYAPADIVSINNAADFKNIQQLPGFEKATFLEVKN